MTKEENQGECCKLAVQAQRLSEQGWTSKDAKLCVCHGVCASVRGEHKSM